MLLTLVAIGTYFIVRSAAKMNAMNQLLEEEDYTRQKKHENRKMSGPVTVYWLIATAIYLAWSFTTNDWDRTWIIWPVVGVLFPAFYAIVNGIRKKSYRILWKNIKEAESGIVWGVIVAGILLLDNRFDLDAIGWEGAVMAILFWVVGVIYMLIYAKKKF